MVAYETERKHVLNHEEVHCLLEVIGQEKVAIKCKLQGTMTIFCNFRSFSANYHCRCCLAHKDDIQIKF